MAQVTDTSAIQQLIARARMRIRLQWALEGATTATILAAAGATAAIFAIRTQLVTPTAGIALLIASGLLVAIGAALSASRTLDDETVARRVDRASNLADRLSTAIAFSREPAEADETADETTAEMKRAAIKDGLRAVPRANLRAATPFRMPKDWRAAIGFLAISAIVAGLSLPSGGAVPVVYRATPDHVRAGDFVTIEGANLTAGVVRPHDAAVELTSDDSLEPATIIEWVDNEIVVQIPPTAKLGPHRLVVTGDDSKLGELPVTIVGAGDERYHKDGSVALDPDEVAYVKSILAQLHDVAQKDKVPELDDFAKKIEELLEKAQNGEITKEELLEALAKAEDALEKNAEPKQEDVDKKLAEMGKELSKDPLTKPLGDELQKPDLDAAKKELEKLANKLDNKELDDKQKQELAKKLDDVAKEMDKQDQQKDKADQQQQDKVKDEIRRLDEQKKDAKTPQQQQELERRLEDKKRELQKLQKDQEEQQQSDQRKAVKRLQKDMQQAAEDLQKPQKGSGDKDDKDSQSQEQKDKQASEKLHEAARETGKVDSDKRKQATQKKMSSQMDDLREAMRRAKQKSNKGPQDPFNKNGKNSDFAQRSRGGKGQGGQGWKPGQTGQQGQGQGQQGKGQGKNGQQGQGSGNGGDEWGVGHDDNLTGDPTQKSGNDKDQDVQGRSGDKGGSTRETILAAAQKGFASVGYKKVYADYQRIVEEVMRTEKLPSSYKYYVKRYFAKIHPNTAEDPTK